MVKLPLCFEASSAASVFRQVLDDMDLVYSRQNGTRRYTRFAAIVALEQSAFSYKYIVDDPSINFEIWSEVPSLSGSITYLGVDGDSKSEFQNSFFSSKKLPVTYNLKNNNHCKFGLTP